ncbi:MAG: hypothetical protein H6665_01445 [Ardenticatenaceae bacterium]|nr:hypothetical protein [Ardenticatenaceae bacterium]MCB8989257.1 hypothetical protein [Ardenticatenaceae bacterium]
MTTFSKRLYPMAKAAFISSVTYLALRIWRYGRRLLRQPRIHIPLPLATPEAITNTGYKLTVANLLAGIEKRTLLDGSEKSVLCAGRRNFREPWARDFSFASYGLIALGELQTVKETLAAFLAYQQPNGQFPVKIHSTTVLDRYLHSLFRREQPIVAPLRPKYITAHNTISLDGNCLLVIAALYYVRQTGDEAFIRQHWAALKMALHWLNEHINPDDGLLHQSAFTDWADSVGRTGRVLYTNVLYWKALHDMSTVCAQYNLQGEAECSGRADKISQAIQSHFWREDLGYFITSEEFTFLSSSGNLLAIAWGLATEAQTKTILDRMDEFGMADPVPTKVTHQPYPRKLVALENRLAGIPEYHTHAAWLWLGAWHAIALARSGRVADAATLLQRMDALICRDGAVHEVYGENGRPLSTLWYTAEAPLTWNAGMIVFAHQQVRDLSGS